MVAKEKYLWSDIMRSKYLKRKSFFEHIKTKGSSYAWQGIFSSRTFLRNGCCFRIGNGLSINIWKDLWIFELQDKILIAKEGADVSYLEKVVDLREPHNMGWNEDLIRTFFEENSAEGILKIVWPANSREDKLIWYGNPRGQFSVGNCYDVNCNSSRLNDEIWKKLWKAHIHERLKIFIWRVLTNVLPSKEVLSERLELRYHILKVWPGARAIAYSSNWGARIDEWPGDNIHDLISVCLTPQGT